MIGLVLLTILVLVGLYFLMLYNGMVTKKLRVSEAWSQIDVQLKRRADLIPNLVETVKGYAKHEKTVFEEVTKARSVLMNASGAAAKGQADNQLSAALKSILAIAEAYPKLEASQNFKELQEELSDTEGKVAYSRQFYNNVVMDYNTVLKVFPNVIFAPTFGFKEAEFFGKDLTDKEREAINVNL
ncbi:MAG: LemA family protein [Patescibacteria group bacterium]